MHFRHFLVSVLLLMFSEKGIGQSCEYLTFCEACLFIKYFMVSVL